MSDIFKKIPEEFRKETEIIFFGINIREIITSFRAYEMNFKIVVFSPPENVEEIIAKMSESGAGVIGNYTVCSFRTDGFGTFKGNDESNPSIGEKGKLETIKETRIEMLCPSDKLYKVIEKIYETHSYEEPAIDIYNVMTPTSIRSGKAFKFEFSERIPVEKLIRNLEELNEPLHSIAHKNISVKSALLDYSEGEFKTIIKNREPMLLIKRNKKDIKVELNSW